MCSGASCPECCKPIIRPADSSCVTTRLLTIADSDPNLPAAKKSWRGCGRHIPSAMSGVPESEWCTCDPKVEVGGKSYPPAAKAAAGGSWLGGLLGGGGQKKDEL